VEHAQPGRVVRATKLFDVISRDDRTEQRVAFASVPLSVLSSSGMQQQQVISVAM
jgi:hypothetical protein